MTYERAQQALRVEQLEGRFDRPLLLLFALLAALGLVMVGSSSIAIAEGLEVSPYHFLIRHAVFLSVGLVMALAFSRIELKELERHSRLLLVFGFVLLLLVFVPGLGRTVNGARRWVNLLVSNFQVVEAVKLLLVIWLSSYLARYRDQVQSTFLAAFKPLIVVTGMVVLLLAQPDFGSAALLLAVTAGLIWLAGVRLLHVLLPVCAGLPVLALVAMSESYRVRRLTSFLNPWEDPFKDGFQLTQALIAIGRGEWTGVGLGASVQKLYYLPEAHTDFIFAVIAEELGFVGILLVVGLFVALTGRAFWLGLRAVDMGRHFAGFCAFGVGLWLGLQSLVSIGVNLGLLPTKGLTLPLISSGGSSVLITCAAFGLLLRFSYEIERTRRQVAHHRAERQPEPDNADAEPQPVSAETPALPLRLGRPGRIRIEPSFGEVA